MAYKWTIYKMVTRQRAEAVALALFPHDYIHRHDDCMNEPGRKGLPCRFCAAKRNDWRGIVGRTRLAMKQAFSGG